VCATRKKKVAENAAALRIKYGNLPPLPVERSSYHALGEVSHLAFGLDLTLHLACFNYYVKKFKNLIIDTLDGKQFISDSITHRRALYVCPFHYDISLFHWLAWLVSLSRLGYYCKNCDPADFRNFGSI